MACLEIRELPKSVRFRFENSFGRSLAGVSVMVGPRVDRYLAGEDSLAEARDASTILLSTRLAGLPVWTRMLVLGHELAHTAQLAERGSDPDAFLEAEAWRASRAALLGLTHPVLGRASQPLCAKGLFDPKFPGKAALDYYKLFDKEPVDATMTIKIEKPEFVAPMNLHALLGKIVACSTEIKGKDLLIVSHGNQAGLVMPLFKKQHKKFYANTVSLNALMTLSAASIAKGSGFPEKDLQELIDRMNAVQALGIQKLVFRGCAIGAKLPALKTLRQFFGAKSAGAPDIKSNFGWLTPNVRRYNKKQWDAWMKKFSRTAVMDTSPAGEHIAVSIDPVRKYTEMLTESAAATKWWMSQRFPSVSTPVYTKGQFPVHSLSTSPRVTFPLDTNYVKRVKRV
ncbi:MAG: hypothetical protein HQ567_13840 [Candidatus Nealsonbacteria bacterium]|nr:hypothetical protein [Candidatus Nealsonbacteria bacterium]